MQRLGVLCGDRLLLGAAWLLMCSQAKIENLVIYRTSDVDGAGRALSQVLTR